MKGPYNKEETQAVEGPYEVPSGWKWVRLGDIYEINPRIKAEDDLEAAFIPMDLIEPGMKGGYRFEVQTWGKVKKGHTQFSDGDVAFAKISPCFENRKSMILKDLPNGIGAGTTELVVLRSTEILQEYTYWLISTETFIRKGILTYKGSVGQQRINMDFVRNYPVPLPPLPEQRRIVSRIESLFAKLERARERAAEALESFEVRRMGMLHRAFTGELIEKESLFSDCMAALEEGCESIFDGDHMPPPKSEKGIAFLVISNVNTGHLSFENTRFVPEEYYNGLTDTRRPERGDVLYTLVGSFGIPALVDSDVPFCFQRHMALLKPMRERLVSTYLWYMLQTNDLYEQAAAIAKGSAQVTVPIKKLRKLRIPIPPYDEQLEIVRRLDSFFAKEAAAKARVEQTLAAIEVLKKTILARAFRGEL